MYLLGLHLAPICPTSCSGRHEAAFQLFSGAVLACMKGVCLTDLTLDHASIALLSCLVNCEETKRIVTHLKRIIWHILCRYGLPPRRAGLALSSATAMQ